MKLLGSRLLLLAAFFTFSSAYFTTTSDVASFEHASSPYFSSQLCLLETDNSFTHLHEKTVSSFQIAYENKAVHISWEVERPQKGSFYMIQRSDDGIEWYTIGGIAIREEFKATQTYDMFDANLKSKTYHYKIKEIQPDGSTVFSPSISVFTGYDKPLSVYPNPVETSLYFEVPNDLQEDAFMEVIDQNGRSVYRESLDATYHNKIRQVIIEDLPTGIYMIRIYTGDKRYTGRIVKK